MLLRTTATPLLGTQHLDRLVESSISDRDSPVALPAELRRNPKREFRHS